MILFLREPLPLPCNFHRESISGLQSFHYVQAPTLARPPGCTHRSLSAGRPGRLHHAPLGWLPAPSCGIATYPNRATDTAGLSPAGLQPCRLLRRPCLYAFYPSSSSRLSAAAMASPRYAARVTAGWLIPSNFDTATAVMRRSWMAQWHIRLLA